MNVSVTNNRIVYTYLQFRWAIVVFFQWYMWFGHSTFDMIFLIGSQTAMAILLAIGTTLLHLGG